MPSDEREKDTAGRHDQDKDKDKDKGRDQSRSHGRSDGGEQDTGMASIAQDWGTLTSPLDVLQMAQTIFIGAQETALRCAEEMKTHCATIVASRTRLDELEMDMSSREAEVVRDTPIEGRTNSETREAMFREVLEQDEKYAAWEQEKAELSTQYTDARYNLELATSQLSIVKRQLDFASNMMRFGAAATENSAAVALPFAATAGAPI